MSRLGLLEAIATRAQPAGLNGHPSHTIVPYVVGGGGAGRNRNPALRDFPLLNRDDGEADATHLRRVARLVDRAMAAGGTHLIIPRQVADWLGDHQLLVAYFAERHDLVAASRSGGIVFALLTGGQSAFRATVEGWQISPGEGLALCAARKLIEPLVTLIPATPARGFLRGALTIRAEKLRTLQVRFVLGRSDRRRNHHRQLFLSLERPGYLMHELPFAEATFAADGSVGIAFDLNLSRGRSLERIELSLVEEDNWRVHPSYPGGTSFALPAIAPAGARLELREITLNQAPRIRRGPPYGVVQAHRPLPYRKLPTRPRDAVIFSSGVSEEGLPLGNYFIETLCRWHADSKIFVGINHGSSPRWRERLASSGLDIVIREAPSAQNMDRDPPGFVAALDAFRRHDEQFDLVWFGHTKGLGHVDEFWYATGRWTIERMFWSRREQIERHFTNPMIGLYAPHYLMMLQEHLAQTDALQRMYQSQCAPLGAMAVSAHYVMRDASVREFCATVDPRFYREGPMAFGGDIYFFEMGMPNVPIMQGYEPAIEPGLGGMSRIPRPDGIESILNDWRHNNAVVAIELEKWRRDPTRFRTRHAEHNKVD